MCAIFGFLAKGDSGPDLARLRKIIRRNAVTVTNNDDAHGLAWVDANQRMGCYKQAGDFRRNMDVLEQVRDARVVIGHLRKTTVGSHTDNHNNHPHIFDGGWVIHNGTVLNYEDLITEWDLYPSTECDTEVLGLIASKINRPRLEQLETIINSVEQTSQFSCMVIDRRPARLWVARRGKPLMYFKAPEGLYFCSFGGDRVCHTDGKFANNQVVEYLWKRNTGGVRKRSLELKPYRRAKFDYRVRGVGRSLKTNFQTPTGSNFSYTNTGFRFENDYLVYEDEDEDDLLLDDEYPEEEEIRICTKCQGLVKQYSDGAYCDCPLHEMDEANFIPDPDYFPEGDDDEDTRWDDVELMTTEELDRINRK